MKSTNSQDDTFDRVQAAIAKVRPRRVAPVATTPADPMAHLAACEATYLQHCEATARAFEACVRAAAALPPESRAGALTLAAFGGLPLAMPAFTLAASAQLAARGIADGRFWISRERLRSLFT